MARRSRARAVSESPPATATAACASPSPASHAVPCHTGAERSATVRRWGLGIRWIGEIGDEDLDPKLLLWDMHRNIDYAAVPPGRTVVQFRFPDAPSATRDWWLVINPQETDVCDHDPGFPVAVTMTGSLRRLIEVWRGDVTWPDALRSGALTIQGPAALRRALPRWFTLSLFAPVARPT